jgi:excisionase family DNA binding protein
MLHLKKLAEAAGASNETEPAGLLTTPEVLERLRISRRTLACWIERGTIPVIKMPNSRRLLFNWNSILGALMRHERGGRQ